MITTQVVKYKHNDVVYVGGPVPEGAEVLETLNILNADEGFDLVRVSDDENVGNSVWLRDGDTKENYKEVEVVDDDNH